MCLGRAADFTALVVWFTRKEPQMLGEILFDVFRRGRSKPDRMWDGQSLLNVGGGSKAIPIPAHYAGWRHLLLDVDATGAPDIVCDARTLNSLAPEQFDAVYCSHNLEHYYAHDALKVLRGFRHVLKTDGFVEIAVPDLDCVMRHAVAQGLGLDDILYRSPAGPIAVIDVIYGFRRQIEQSGRDFYAHKTGFGPASLRATLERSGFESVVIVPRPEQFEVRAFAFKSPPTDDQRRRLAIDIPGAMR
jgi:SAM-dependent methyltransferase